MDKYQFSTHRNTNAALNRHSEIQRLNQRRTLQEQDYIERMGSAQQCYSMPQSNGLLGYVILIIFGVSALAATLVYFHCRAGLNWWQ